MTNAEEIREKLRTVVDRIGERYFVDPATESLGSEALDRFERLDHVLITDGEVVNAEEVVGYVERPDEPARTFVFLTDEGALDEWLAVTGERVWVYPAADPEDLAGLAVGRSRDLTRRGG